MIDQLKSIELSCGEIVLSTHFRRILVRLYLLFYSLLQLQYDDGLHQLRVKKKHYFWKLVVLRTQLTTLNVKG